MIGSRLKSLRGKRTQEEIASHIGVVDHIPTMKTGEANLITTHSKSWLITFK